MNGDERARSLGSTVPYVVERILQQGEEVNKDRIFLPTGDYCLPQQVLAAI